VKSNSSDSGEWQPCPPGELVKTAGSLRSQHRIVKVARLATVSALLLLVAGAVYIQMGPGQNFKLPGQPQEDGEFHFGGISCTEVHRALPGLKARTLDDATLARVREHLEKCPHCKPLARFLQDPVQTGQMPAADPKGHWPAQTFVSR
jgi:predicted anti-sigma-YlaC factor YlaD